MPPRDCADTDEIASDEFFAFGCLVIHALMSLNPRGYPFRAEDVALIHRYRGGVPGIWYRLHDGRVFDKDGRPSEPGDPAWYTARVN